MRGTIILCRETAIDPDEDAQTLTTRLAELGADALSQAVEQLKTVPPSVCLRTTMPTPTPPCWIGACRPWTSPEVPGSSTIRCGD